MRVCACCCSGVHRTHRVRLCLLRMRARVACLCASDGTGERKVYESATGGAGVCDPGGCEPCGCARLRGGRCGGRPCGRCGLGRWARSCASGVLALRWSLLARESPVPGGDARGPHGRVAWYLGGRRAATGRLRGWAACGVPQGRVGAPSCTSGGPLATPTVAAARFGAKLQAGPSRTSGGRCGSLCAPLFTR